MFIDIEFWGEICKKRLNTTYNIPVVYSSRVSELYIGLVNIVLKYIIRFCH